MAYKIRYGPEKTARSSTFFLRLAGSAGLLAGVLLTQMLWPEGKNVLQELLKHAPETELEQVTAAFAAEIAAGEEWRNGLAKLVSKLLS